MNEAEIKEIEEMANILLAQTPIIDIPFEQFKQVAKVLYNVGYRKLKNNIVLVGNGCQVESDTFEQYEKFIGDIVKEAIEEFAGKLKENSLFYFRHWRVRKAIDDLLKEYGI